MPDMEAVLDQYRRAQRELEYLRDLVRLAAPGFLESAEGDEEKARRATWIYWEVPEVDVKVVAKAIFGEEKHTTLVCRYVGPDPAPGVCLDCGGLTTRKSRSAERKCRFCEEKAAEYRQQRNQEYAAQREREESNLQRLRVMPYREYLQTDHWAATRGQKLRQAGYACQLCNARGGVLDVHHRTYERRGFEWMGDLIVLCRDCHAKFHDKIPA